MRVETGTGAQANKKDHNEGGRLATGRVRVSVMPCVGAIWRSLEVTSCFYARNDDVVTSENRGKGSTSTLEGRFDYRELFREGRGLNIVWQDSLCTYKKSTGVRAGINFTTNGLP